MSMSGIKATVAHLAGDPAWLEADVRSRYLEALRGPDLAEGVAAFLDGRPARFQGS